MLCRMIKRTRSLFSAKFLSACLASLLILLCTIKTNAADPPVTLAQVYDQNVDLSLYWVSEKYDGVRAYWDGKHLLSRQGNIFNAPAWFTVALPDDIALDGELWIKRGAFAEVSGTVRKMQPVDAEWRHVVYKVFDQPNRYTVFSDRYQQLQIQIRKVNADHVQLVEQRTVTSHQALMLERDQITKAGGEGLMLRRHDRIHSAGRSDDLLKVKPYDDAEGRVIAHLPGKGKHTGRMGALLIKLADGRQFKIGTGFTDLERENPPPIDSLITFRYQGLTRKGLPRFARFLRIRSDIN